MTQNHIISQTTHINASASTVWKIITDVAHMGKRSPQCKTMIVLGKKLGPGALTLNINHHKWAWWITFSRILQYEPDKIFSFVVTVNKVVWKYEIIPDGQGVTLTESRNTADRKPIHEKILIIFGGDKVFTEEMREGISETLFHIKYEAERAKIAG